MNRIATFTSLAALMASSALQASTVTVGALQRIDGSQLISDTLNGREWLGWDVTRHMTFDQAMTATAAGGVFAGFSIARNVDAQLFVDALSGTPNLCGTTGNEHCQEGASASAERLVGESYEDFRALYGIGSDIDVAFFLSDNGIGQDIGMVQIFTYDDPQTQNIVQKLNEWSSVADANFYTQYTTNGQFSGIGWMLYRDTNHSIPEPNSLFLVAMGLLTATVVRRLRN
jgi:hypothetical protein